MSQDLQTLVFKRASIKTKLTKFKNYYLHNFAELNELKYVELGRRFERIVPLLDEYEAFQLQIDEIAEGDINPYSDDGEFENDYFAIVSEVQLKLQGYEAATFKAAAAVNNQSVKSEPGDLDGQSSSDSNCSNTINTGIRLPTINLPKFDGNFVKWLDFKNTYESLIHSNNAIKNVQKFHYLKASLQDNAAQVIKAITISDKNYTIAWNILCSRYDNKKLLVHNHIKSIFNLETIIKESAYKIRKLIDNVNTHLKSLESLDLPTEHWDVLLIYIIVSKLDNASARAWETEKGDTAVPTLVELIEFLKQRANLLETFEVTNLEKHKFKQSTSRSLAINNTISCNYCKKEHTIYKCNDFLNLEVNERIKQVKQLKLCENCLRTGHNQNDCRFGHCHKCKIKHNTLLHVDPVKEVTTGLTTNNNTTIHTKVLLSTISMKVYDKNKDNFRVVRAILDSGSQNSFVTEELVEHLDLNKARIDITVSGLSQNLSAIKFKCNLSAETINNKFKCNLNCLIIKDITGYLPSFVVNQDDVPIPQNLTLADPKFYEPQKIDVLIGADYLWSIVGQGQIKLGKYLPVLQESKFGWVVSGPITINKSQQTKTYCNLVNNFEVQEQLQQFWELEEVLTKKQLSREEEECERNFVANYKRLEQGRFMVKIPLKASSDELGESYETAKKRFLTLERKFDSNPLLKRMYFEFLSEYEHLGHMTHVNHTLEDKRYFMPHHGVLKEESETTKLRVVFNASQATTSGKSLNDLQMVGPVLQDDLFTILVRFRQYKYVFCADVEKMYRQVLVDPSQRHLQCILYRTSPEELLKVYELNTITHGTASGSFLAIRSLQQLGHDCKDNKPIISQIILRDFYVDDLLSGSDSIEEAKEIIKDISSVLNEGCFNLRKWVSNSKEIINSETKEDFKDLGREENKKTLGLTWSVKNDCFKFNISQSKASNITKRTILSEIAQIFDPLGLLSPCTIIAKIILQKLWVQKLSWDDEVVGEVRCEWLKFRDSLPELNSHLIKRHVKVSTNLESFELHGFADASERAYGAAIYVKTKDKNGNISIRLLCSKSKVSPLKVCTIPKLELCSALLLANLTKKVINALSVKPETIYLWSDSTIVLGWLKTEPNLLKQFVGNRVADIQRLTKIDQWNHVSTQNNPADLITRGVNPSALLTLSFWWEGPTFLQKDSQFWPSSKTEIVQLPELRKQKQVCLVGSDYNLIDFTRFSNFNRLIRAFAYSLRFVQNCKTKVKKSLPLETSELDYSLSILIKIAQAQSFSHELQALEQKRDISSKSKILSLTPFLDKHGSIRVGGRLSNSEFEYNVKYPILLCSKHHLTKLLFQYEHKRLLHLGSQGLLYAVRQKYWPIGGKALAKSVVRGCVRCFKAKPKFLNPIMGNLPPERITPAIPFTTTGIDYAGPFFIKDRPGRCPKLTKVYICIFICFVTKATHLELVSDLTSECFIMALRRFVARRSKPNKIMSDNGTNFIGANNSLKELGEFLIKNNLNLTESIANEGIEWKFIPPHAPHFGGLWEAAVKSVKHHLKRVASNVNLTFEEFNTLLCQIEAILNSRPLSPMSSDPNDLTPLTPGHFLIGAPLTSVLEENLMDVPCNRLKRFQLIQKLKQDFWTRWSKEYVTNLQQRTKWQKSYLDIKIGDLVLVKEDNLPPSKWLMGRIEDLHPGKDSISRVATIKTRNGSIKRNFQKFCVLPKT